MGNIERMERIDENALIQSDILAFIDRNQNKELLRFVTVGSVDDGKSTLIGRLLHDTKGVYDDQLKDATRTSETGEEAIDFAVLVEALRFHRTVPVAVRGGSPAQMEAARAAGLAPAPEAAPMRPTVPHIKSI